MLLYLSNRSPLNSVYTNVEGQVLYRTQSPIILRRKTTISRVVPNDINSEPVEDMQDRFGLLAEIEYNALSSSIIRFRGEEIKTKEYFRKDGWGPIGRHLVFTGPDDIEYKWLLHVGVSELVVNNEEKTVVARFDFKSLGIIGSPHPATLEITEAGEHMPETVLVTFIYVELRRKHKRIRLAA